MKTDDNVCCVPLSVAESSILLGAVTTFSGVPFVRIRKPEISQRQLEELDRLHDVLAEIRTKCSQSKKTEDPQPITVVDCHQILEILEQCKHEYAGDLLDLRIHLSATCDSDLENLSRKLRHALGLPLS